jgi:hypothetical protein
MNDRIREFKLQAGIEDNPDQEGLDLFAELIVKECAEQIAHNQKFNWLDAAQAAKDLKQHFGVEE